MDYIEHLGDIVRFHRKKAGISQKSLADVAGVGKTVVFDIEKGKETIQLKSVIYVCKALNINVVLNSPLMDKYNIEHEKS
jgi:HTH-type transcriptional regulator / antitoxin HipB